ncbi:MAG: iron-sulfur cluster assembly scaffold protein [Hyphomicrobiaceae bacterium]|nr:iron-sulfur cluster assembly scaffold protein [Hyphomicrobiaceae bacterium]
MDDLYNRQLLELAGSIAHIGLLDGAMGTATRHSRLCGSTVTVSVDVDAQGRVCRFGQDVKACALGQASSSILGRHVIGRSLTEIETARDGLRALLKEGVLPQDPNFPELDILAPVRDYKARHASTMLAFEAAAEAVAQALGGKEALGGEDVAPALDGAGRV